jgi:hypothetical protein
MYQFFCNLRGEARKLQKKPRTIHFSDRYELLKVSPRQDGEGYLAGAFAKGGNSDE